MRTLIVEADGASRGNPGPASYGAVLRDEESGELLAELAGTLGTATNNFAEYRGLIAGLEAAAALDPDARVRVRMDSKLVVEQMSGRWQIKHPDMKPLAERARAVLPAGNVSYQWVPRAENRHADRLANEALDAAAAAPQAAPKAAWAPDLGRPTRLLLLRHGVTPLTLEKRFAGVGDPPLTELGQEQARRAAARLSTDERFGPIDVILSSPLRRTMATAEAVAKAAGLEVSPDPGFRELDFGRFEGLSFAEAHERFPAELAAFLASTEVPPPGGESLAELAVRVTHATDQLIARHPRRTVLVVTHVTPIKTLICRGLGAPLASVNRMELGPASLSVVDFYDDGLANVRCVNDIAHLG